MVGDLMSLWLPILVSAVVVFVASAIAWMVLPHHKGDWKGVPNEDALLEAVRSSGVKPGQYMFPYCESPKDLSDPEKKKRYDAGPHGVLSVWPGPPNMGQKMGLSFLFYVVVGIFVAYMGLAAYRMGVNPTYMEVFRVTGCAAVLAYCFGLIPNAIWFSKPLRSVAMDVIDGVVYGLLTAGVFGWLWPTVQELAPAMPPMGG